MEKNPVKRPAVFLDRDGTINQQMGYINHISRFILLPGVSSAIKRLNHHGYLTIVVSNQSGVARGYFPIGLVHEVHDHMKSLLGENGATVDGIFFCPHHPAGKVDKYSKLCDCRKPGTGLIKKSMADFDIDMEKSYVVGDRYTDIEMARRCGLKAILVKTGYGMGDLEYVIPQCHFKPDHIASNLQEAVDWILEN
ncbi:MAG: HAD family hydrolase [Deltaproteobacteria bacterium]|jgi:D-glycero-D-manno-heptose 1,7-bisphosphate phosphatase